MNTNIKFSILFLFIASFIIASCTKDPNCGDGIQNGGELGIDCCGPCDSNCVSIPNCVVAIPTESCFDGILNQDETEVDCGGVCPACETSDTTDVMNGDNFFTIIRNASETFNYSGNQITYMTPGNLYEIEFDFELDPDGFLPLNSFTLYFDFDNMEIGSYDLSGFDVNVAFLNQFASPCSSESGILTITAGGAAENFIEGTLDFQCGYLTTEPIDSFTNGSFYLSW